MPRQCRFWQRLQPRLLLWKLSASLCARLPATCLCGARSLALPAVFPPSRALACHPQRSNSPWLVGRRGPVKRSVPWRSAGFPARLGVRDASFPPSLFTRSLTTARAALSRRAEMWELARQAGQSWAETLGTFSPHPALWGGGGGWQISSLPW